MMKDFIIKTCLEGVRVMVFNVTFNNISANLAVSFIGGGNRSTRKKKHRHAASYWQTLSHNVVSSTARPSGIRTHNVRGDRQI